MIKTTLQVDSMMCGMCENHINDAIRRNFSIKKVTSSHTKGEVVIISENELDKDKIRSVIDETGYTLKGVKSEAYEGKTGLLGIFGRRK